MATCSHKAPNGEKSLLYQKLNDIYGPAIASQIWDAVRSQQFLNKHGDWMNPRAGESFPLDINGEPTYEWTKELLDLQEPATPVTEQKTILYDALEPQKRAFIRASEEVTDEKIRELYTEATSNPDTTYTIPYKNIGDKKTFNSGFTARELANFFDRYPIPSNVQFDPSFYTLIQNSSRRILGEMSGSDLPPELMDRGEQSINEHMLNILTPKTSADGRTVGYFTPVEQQEVVDSIIHFTQAIMLADPDAKANALIKSIYAMYQKAKQIENQGGDQKLMENLMYIYQQRVRFADATMRQMEGLGLSTDDKTKANILRAVNELKPLSEIEKKQIEDTKPELLADLYDETTGEFIEAAGRGLKDWGDISFELDPKDTASARMKMFIATLPDMDRGVYRVREGDVADVTIDPTAIKVKDNTLDELIRRNGAAKAFKIWNSEDPLTVQKIVRQVNRRTVFVNDNKTTQALVDFFSQQYPLVAKENFLGMRKLVDYEATFQDILETLADTKQDLQRYYDALTNSGKPNMQYLVQELKKADLSVQKEFAKVMSKQYQQFTMVLFNRITDKEGKEATVLNPINANRYNQRNTIIKNWQQLQKLSDIMIINPAGDRIINVERIRAEWLPLLEQIDRFIDWSDAQIIYARNAMQQVLNLSGVDMNEEMMQYLFDNMDKITKKQKFSGGLSRQFSITKDGKPNGIFSAFILKAAGATAVDENEEVTEQEALNRAELHNPLYTEKSTMQILASVAARFTSILHSQNHRSSEGKNIWDYGLNTKLSHKMRDFITNFDAVKNTLNKIDFARDNWLVNTITNNPSILTNIRLSYLDGMRSSWSRRGTTRQSMSDREQMLMSVALFQNQGMGFNKIPRVNYLSLTHSDKTTTPIFSGMPKLNTGTASVMEQNIIGNTSSAMYNIFRAEHERIVKQKGVDFNNARYNKGKNLFYMIPDFNYDAMRGLVSQGIITERDFKLIWLNGSRELTQHINSDKELPVINKILTYFTNNLIADTLSEWQSNGIIDPSDFTILFDSKYVKKVLYQNGITSGRVGENTVYKDNTNKVLSDEEVYNVITTVAAKDYALNHFLFNTAVSQIFYGDPAQTYKGKADTHDLVQVDATMKEYAKRLAKDIAPGQDLYWESSQRKYTTITIADVKTSEEYLRNFANLQKAYAATNAEDHEGPVEATDAQELTTTQEHIDTFYAGGLISFKIYNEMSKIIQDAKGEYYEFISPEHLAVVMQPQKPVYAGTREVLNGAQLEDYIKSSSYPLYPPFTVGLEMDKLRQLMENPQSPIQRANFESAKKIGLPNKPVTLFTKMGEFVIPKESELHGATQVLDRAGFRIQQEVPYDEEKETIKTVTQENKLIVEGITDITREFRIGEQMMSGTQVREYKEQVRTKMIQDNLKTFLQQLSVNKDAINNGKWEITNKPKVWNILAEEARKKGYTLNELQSLLIIDREGDLEIPLMFNTAADRLESMLMSMVRKVVEIKMPGKSFIQAASVGYTFTKEGNINRSKITWLSSYDGSPLRTLRKGEAGEVLAAQVLLPFNYSAKDGSRLNLEDFTIKLDNGRRIINEDKLPLELLQLVGARIPNQGHNSMLPIEVVGFIPANMGDLIIVPSAITKQMGADFDVDKLFTYRRNYIHNEETGNLETVTTTDSVSEMNMAQLQDAYFNVHWGILMHPDMTEKVLRPLDKPDLEDENKKLAKPQRADSHYHVMNQLKDFQSGKEAKILVGSTSLSVTFNAVIQNKDLHLYKKVISTDEDGMPTQNEERVFINVRDEHTGEVLPLHRLSGNGISNYTEVDGGLISPTAARTKHDNHTTTQSAAVDNAKNRTLDNINLTRNTYRAAAAFIQLETQDGKAVNLKYITRLLTQPIIKEFDQRMKTGNDSLSEEFTKNLKESIFNNLRVQYASQVKDKVDWEEVYETTIFNPQLLLKAQQIDPTTDEYFKNQVAALYLFTRLDEIGNRLVQLQALFNQDTNGAGPNILSSLQKAERLENVDQVPINGAGDIFSSETELTEQGATFQATIDVSNQVLSQLLPYNTMTNLFDKIQTISLKDQLSIDQQRAIVRNYRSFVYTSGTQWWEDPQQDRIRLFYGDESLAKRIVEAKRTWGKDNYFLQRLDGNIGNSKESPDYIEYQAVAVGRIDEEQNSRGWLNMLTSNSENERRLGEDLIRYAYLTGGIQDANSFVKFVPVSYIAGTSFGGMLKDRIDELVNAGDEIDILNAGFIGQYFQHNPEIAFQVSKTTLDALADGSTTDYPEVFKIPNIEDPRYSQLGIANFITDDINSAEEFEYTPYVSYRSKVEGKWILYAKQTTGDSTYYVRIDTLGNQYTDEYNGLVDQGHRSIFTENRAMSEYVGDSEIQGLSDIENMMYYELNDQDYPVNEYEKLGIREGGQEAIDTALGTIEENPSLPEYLRTTARVLRNSKGNLKEFTESLELLGVTNYSPKIVLKQLQGNIGGTASASGTITLNTDSAQNSKDAATIFLHEAVHQRIQTIIVASGYDTRFNRKMHQLGQEGNYGKMKAEMNMFASRYPETMEHIHQLDFIRAQAMDELRKQLGNARVEQILQDIDNRFEGVAITAEHNLIYGVYSIQELTTHVMTDDSVAQFLRTLSVTSQGDILSRIWQAIVNIVTSFAKSLGMKVPNKTNLENAIEHTLGLIDPAYRNADITEAILNGRPLRVDTQMESDAINYIVNKNYNRETNTSQDENGYTIEVSNDAIIAAPSTQVDKVIGKLNDQLKETGRNISKAKTPQEKVQAVIRYRGLLDDISKLKRTQDLNLITEIGSKQLKWIDNILSQSNPTSTQVYAAINAANIWSGVIDLMYGDQSQIGSIDPGFSNLQAEAQARRIQLINEKARGVVIDALGHRIQFKPQDFGTSIEEIHVAEANLITLSRVKPILAQGIAVIGRQAANNRDEEIYRVSKKLDVLKAQMKKNNITSEHFLEPGHWALATRLTREWYDAISDFRKSLDSSIHAADQTTGITDTARRNIKIKAWDQYWREMRSVAAFVDTRYLFDFNDGSIKTDAAAVKTITQLTKEVGSQQYASELIDQAQELYKEYLTERDIAHDYFQSSIVLEESEKQGLAQEQQDALLEKKIQDAYENWLSYNSPNEFMGRMNGKSGRANAGDRFIVKAPKQAKFYSERYKQIQDSAVMKPMYDQYRDIIQEMVAYLPATEREKLNEDFLPIVSNDLVVSLSDIVTKIKNWDATLMNTFAATEAEEYARIKPNEIPIRYTRSSKKMEEEGNMSQDIIRVTEVFAMMALHYKHMAPVLDQINVAESIIKEVNRQRVNKETAGKPLEQLQKSITYFKDALIFKKPRNLEGKLDNPIYSIGKPAKQIKIEREVQQLSQRKKQIEKEQEEQWLQGNTVTPELDEELVKINDQLNIYAANSRNIYGSKVTDWLISVNQLKALGYNPFSAISNFTFGMVSLFIHASGRVDYDQKTARRAMGIMSNSVGKYYTFGTVDNAEAKKVLALMDRLGIIGEVVDTQIGGSNLRDRSKGWKSALAPFNWQKSGDYFAKGTVMIAMLLKKQVEVEENGEKKSIPLWEALDGEGKWNEARFGVHPEWYSEEAAEQTEWNNYRDRIRKVGTMVFGNQDKNAPLMARKSWLFRLAGQFRMSWLPEGVATRWMDERFDAELGRNVKGRWKSITSLGWFTSAGLIAKQLLAQLPGVKFDPFNGIVDKKGDPISELDIENMRKNFSGLAFTVAFLASILLLRGLYEDDKKRGKKKTMNAMQRQLLLNMLIRNHQDLMMYASPTVLDTVTGNLLPATAVVTDAWKAVKATTHYLIGDTSKEKDPADKWILKVSRAFPITNLYPKTKYMMKRDLDAITK